MDNAECCNLPAEYVCKCKQGFEGDGQVECRGELERILRVIVRSGVIGGSDFIFKRQQ